MEILKESTKIGWIGTGVMGASMAGRLMDAGYQCNVYNRTQSKASSLLEKGAQWYDSPGEVAANSHIVFTIVGFPADVEEVYFGNKGILANIKEGTVLVDMTTTKPSLAQKIAKEAGQKNAWAIDAPVSGGDVGARNGTLSIMIGGNKQVVKDLEPLFAMMGSNIVYQGEAGSGQHTKMCNQITIAGTMIGVCESLLYAYRAGLDPTTMLRSISGGAAACWTLDNLAPRIIKQDYEPGFYVNHFIKDMGIALEEAEQMNLALPGLGLVKQLYLSLKAQGHEKKGTQALILALKKLNGDGSILNNNCF